MRKSLLEEVQELEARAVDPGAAVLRDASGRRLVYHRTASWEAAGVPAHALHHGRFPSPSRKPIHMYFIA